MENAKVARMDTRSAFVLLVAALLSGCSGGGGGDSPPARDVPPTAVFTTNPASGEAPLTVTLDASGSRDTDGRIVSYQWSFSDGSADATGQRIEHTFGSAGNFEITLTVTDDDRLTSRVSSEIDVSSANQPPVADLRASADAGSAPLMVQFDASGSSDPDGNDLEFLWNFGDGSNAVSGAIVQHSFALAGTYTTSVAVSDGFGGTAEATRVITVVPGSGSSNQSPIAVISATPVSGSAPLIVFLDGTNSTDPDGVIAEYRWDFGDGTPVALSPTVQHTYDAPGSYKAALRVTDDDGAWVSQSTQIEVLVPSDDDGTFGLSSRPGNTTCIAPARTTDSSGYSLADAFPSLPNLPTPMKLIQPEAESAIWYAVGRNGALDRFANDGSANTIQRYLNLSVTAVGEGGFLSAVLHPAWPDVKQIFVSYTIDTGSGLKSRLSRLVITGDSTLPATYTEQILLTVDQPRTNHNGGDLAIGPDGFLYWGLGDGGGAGDPDDYAQDTTRLLGSMLRIDAIGVAYPAPGYRIPAGNPFAGNPVCGPAGNANDCPEIFAYGLRNPWRFSFDDQENLWAADVGQDAWEEIDLIVAGGNYGWRCREGRHDYNTTGCPSSGFVEPVYEYPQTNGNGSITGGFVYSGTSHPSLQDRYLFADYLTGRIWALANNGGTYSATQLLDSSVNIASFAQGNSGEVYVLGIGTGRVYRLVGGGGITRDNVPDSLADTGCVDPADPTRPASGLVPYAPVAPFWSDGATKERWMALPNGTTIDVLTDKDWAFPPGSVLIKNFEVAGQPIETRLFMRHPDGGWAGYTYEWNDQGTAASRLDGGAVRDIGGQNWIFPSQAECLGCHTQAAGFALGPETAQLNSEFFYESTGITDNQLRVFNHIGMFSVAIPEPLSQQPALVDPADVGADLNARARAYLHTNCAQCHRPNGPTGANLDLRYGTSLAATGACNTLPQAGDLGIADARIIAPGVSDRSVLPERVNRRDDFGMPPLASNLVDVEGVQLLRDWIDSLSTCAP